MIRRFGSSTTNTLITLSKRVRLPHSQGRSAPNKLFTIIPTQRLQSSRSLSIRAGFQKWIGIDDIKAQHTNMTTEIKNVNGKVEDVRTQNAEIKSGMNNVSSDVKSVSGKIDEIKTQHASVMTQVASLASNIGTQYQAMERQLGVIAGNVNTVNGNVSVVNTKMDGLVVSIRQVEEKLGLRPGNKSILLKLRENLTKFKDHPYKSIKDLLSNLTFVTAALVIGVELWENLRSKEKISAVDPRHRQKTKIAKKLLNLLARLSEYHKDTTGLREVRYQEGVYGVWMVGSSGTGKSIGLEDLIQEHTFSSTSSPIGILFDCTTRASFRNQVIDRAKELGMRQIDGYDITYDDAVRFLKTTLVDHPGWLIAFDQVDDMVFINEFIHELRHDCHQAGRVVVATNNTKLALEQLAQESEVVWHKRLFNLNSPEQGFDGQTAFHFFEALTTGLYKKEELTYGESLVKKTEFFRKFFPGFPHTDRKLKEELIKQLGRSPLAIQMAASYLNAEFIRTQKSPQLLISGYLEELSKRLGTRKGEFLFDVLEDLEEDSEEFREKSDNLYARVSTTVYAMALEKVEELSSQNDKRWNAQVVQGAKMVLPLCVSLDPRHLHQRYLNTFLLTRDTKSDTNQSTSLKLPPDDLMQVTDLLCQYGVLRRYIPIKNQAVAREYTQFFVHPSLREAYLEFEVERTYRTNKQFNNDKKNEPAIKAGTLSKRNENRQEIRIEVEGRLLGDAMQFVSRQFHLNSQYLDSEGLDWQFPAHSLQLLRRYEASKGKISKKDLTTILKFINPILNMSVQAGYIKELKVFHQEVSQFLNLLQEEKELSGGLSADRPEGVKVFCEKLSKVDRELPTLYAQFIYYSARMVVKVKPTSEQWVASYQAIQLAAAMRSVIDAGDEKQYAKFVFDMKHDTATIQRDGIGLLYLETDTVESLKKAKEHYQAIVSTTHDDHNKSACLRFLAQIKCRLASLSLRNTPLAGDQKRLNEVAAQLSEAMTTLDTSEDIMKSKAPDEKRYAKTGRYYLVKGELHEVEAELAHCRGDQAARIASLRQAAQAYQETKRNAGFDRRSDQAMACTGLARVKQQEAHLDQSYSLKKREKLLTSGLKDISHGIKIQESIKIRGEDKGLVEAYLLKANLLNQLGRLQIRLRNPYLSLVYSYEANCILERIKKLNPTPWKADIEELDPQLTELNELLRETVFEEVPTCSAVVSSHRFS